MGLCCKQQQFSSSTPASLHMDLALGSIPGRSFSCSVVLHGLRCLCFAQDLSPSGWANSNRFLPGLSASLVTSVIFSTLGRDTQGSLRSVSHQILQLKLLLLLTVNLTPWWLASPKALLVATLPTFAHTVSLVWSTVVLLPDLMNCFSFKFQFQCHLLSVTPSEREPLPPLSPQRPW